MTCNDCIHYAVCLTAFSERGMYIGDDAEEMECFKNKADYVEVKHGERCKDGRRCGMKTEIIKVKGDWQEVVDDCRVTVGKESLGKEPSEAFKRKILIAEHSPIRDISIKWRWRDMAHWITVHWVRHKWEKFVRTQRTDRTGIDRRKLPQDEPQTFVGEANVQHLIDTMRKRLCFEASKETRKYAEDLKKTIHEVEPEIADVLVPNCVYRCGCPEMGGCIWYDLMLKKHPKLRSTNIQERYNEYNKIFYNDLIKKKEQG